MAATGGPPWRFQMVGMVCDATNLFRGCKFATLDDFKQSGRIHVRNHGIDRVAQHDCPIGSDQLRGYAVVECDVCHMFDTVPFSLQDVVIASFS